MMCIYLTTFMQNIHTHVATYCTNQPQLNDTYLHSHECSKNLHTILLHLSKILHYTRMLQSVVCVHAVILNSRTTFLVQALSVHFNVTQITIQHCIQTSQTYDLMEQY